MTRTARGMAAALLAVLVSCQPSPAATTPTPAQPSPTATLPTEQARREHFLEVWSAVKQNYYRSDFGGLDWERMRAEYEPRVVEATNAVAYHAAIAAMLERFGDGHTAYLSRPTRASEISNWPAR